MAGEYNHQYYGDLIENINKNKGGTFETKLSKAKDLHQLFLYFRKYTSLSVIYKDGKKQITVKTFNSLFKYKIIDNICYQWAVIIIKDAIIYQIIEKNAQKKWVEIAAHWFGTGSKLSNFYGCLSKLGFEININVPIDQTLQTFEFKQKLNLIFEKIELYCRNKYLNPGLIGKDDFDAISEQLVESPLKKVKLTMGNNIQYLKGKGDNCQYLIFPFCEPQHPNPISKYLHLNLDYLVITEILKWKILIAIIPEEFALLIPPNWYYLELVPQKDTLMKKLITTNIGTQGNKPGVRLTTRSIGPLDLSEEINNYLFKINSNKLNNILDRISKFPDISVHNIIKVENLALSKLKEYTSLHLNRQANGSCSSCGYIPHKYFIVDDSIVCIFCAAGIKNTDFNWNGVKKFQYYIDPQYIKLFQRESRKQDIINLPQLSLNANDISLHNTKIVDQVYYPIIEPVLVKLPDIKSIKKDIVVDLVRGLGTTKEKSQSLELPLLQCTPSEEESYTSKFLCQRVGEILQLDIDQIELLYGNPVSQLKKSTGITIQINLG